MHSCKIYFKYLEHLDPSCGNKRYNFYEKKEYQLCKRMVIQISKKEFDDSIAENKKFRKVVETYKHEWMHMYCCFLHILTGIKLFSFLIDISKVFII